MISNGKSPRLQVGIGFAIFFIGGDQIDRIGDSDDILQPGKNLVLARPILNEVIRLGTGDFMFLLLPPEGPLL